MGQATPDIQRVVGELVAAVSRRARVERVILFGSRARGDASSDSDIDLLVVSADFGQDVLADYALLYLSLPPVNVDVDLIPSTPEQLASAEPESFLASVLEDGVVIYPRAS